jgi:hypothetical protein
MDADDDAQRATRFLVAPVPPRTVVADVGDLDDTIPAVLPQPGRARPIRSDWRTRRQNALRPGDLICGDCGQGNAPRRRFCARCGGCLDEAEVVPRRWWHRFRLRRGPRQIALTADVPGQPSSWQRIEQPGERRRRWFRRAQITGSGVIAFFTVAYVSYPPFQIYVNRESKPARNKIVGVFESQYDPVRPATVTASTFLEGHNPEQAADQFKNTYWAAKFQDGATARQKSRTVTFNFDRLVTLNEVIITAGALDDFTAHGRPRLIMLSFSNGSTMTLTMKDTVRQQKFDLDHAIAVKSVKMTVAEEFPGEKHNDVAVSEVEFLALIS